MNNNDLELLILSDGTITINLLDLCLEDWRPAVLGLKGSATFLDSPYTQGRQLVQASFDDVTDLFVFNPKEESADDLIESGQDVRRLLEIGRNYWLTKWQDTPVYIYARGICETNTRYSQVTNYLTPEDGNPYASPFSPDTIFEDWNLSITHRPWQEVAPGETVCVEAFSQKGYCISSVEYDGSTGANITIPDNAVIQDLPTGDFTVESWIYAQDNPAPPSLSIGYLISKTNWFITIFDVSTENSGVEFQLNHAITNAEYISSGTSITIGEWQHIAAVWDSATKTAKIFVNGKEVGYTTQTAGNGAYTTDVGVNLQIGNSPGLLKPLGSIIGWTRISNTKLYTSDFTPPERCFLPGIVASTIGIWIYEGTGATADNAEGTAAIDGTLNNMNWVQGCADGSDSLFGREDGTCLKENFFSLSGALNQITHVFVYDASGPTYSTNLQQDNTWPVDLFPAVPAAGDILYIGAETSRINTGVFNNVIFDINDASSQINTFAYEYWDGAAWSAIPNIRDTTDGGFGFGSTDGVGGLFYEIPSDWSTTTINGITGYWIRIRITGIPVFLTIPEQDNRRIYTANWNWINIDEDSVPGDIPALAYSIIYGEGRNEDEDEGIPSFQRIIMSLRSDSRGTGFDPFINISDVQEPCGVTVTKEATGTWTADIVNAPTGRYLVDVATGTGWQDICTISFDDTIALDYYGAYRVYLVAKTSTATIQYRLKTGIGPDEVFTEAETVIDTGVFEVVELGDLELPFSDDIANNEVLESLDIVIQANITAIGNQTEYIALVVMPSDEFIVDTSSFDATEAIRDDHPLDIDSIKYPKKVIRTWQKSNGDYEYSWKNDAVGAFFLQNNTDQRLFFFGGEPGTDNWVYNRAVNAIQLFRNARYHSMRGSR